MTDLEEAFLFLPQERAASTATGETLLLPITAARNSPPDGDTSNLFFPPLRIARMR